MHAPLQCDSALPPIKTEVCLSVSRLLDEFVSSLTTRIGRSEIEQIFSIDLKRHHIEHIPLAMMLSCEQA